MTNKFPDNTSQTGVHSPKMANLLHITDEVLQVLDARSKDIITRRFGLKSNKRETLESIGKEYGITRERVRQIEVNAKKSLAALEDLLRPAQEYLTHIFGKHGGVLTESNIVEIIQEKNDGNVTGNVVHFYLDICPYFHNVTSSDLFAPHWRHKPSVHTHVDNIVVAATEILKNERHPVPLVKLTNDIRGKLQEHSDTLPDPFIHAALVASKHIAPTAFGDWGLIGWAETSPRGVGDKAFSVLRRHGSPAHFRDITDMINNTGFDHKTANPQTVHNELIKDNRFVLVGRGLYGLKEWGYMSGTVADVLESILKRAQQPLTRDELIGQVLKQRLVKKNTILLSLHNNKRFVRTGKNRYTLRESG